MASENAAANSNNIVSNLTRNNYNKENDVIELKDQQQELINAPLLHYQTSLTLTLTLALP